MMQRIQYQDGNLTFKSAVSLAGRESALSCVRRSILNKFLFNDSRNFVLLFYFHNTDFDLFMCGTSYASFFQAMIKIIEVICNNIRSGILFLCHQSSG